MNSPARTGSRWIEHRRPVADPELRLFCFPYGAGSASFFRGWASHLPERVDLCPVQLPGRERRMAEAPFTELVPLARELARVLRPYFDVPFAFFGHSMGALISFELARALRRAEAGLPAGLLVSGARAPHVPEREPPIHELPDDEFVDKIRELNGTPDGVLDEPELVELYLPLLRADIGLCERYVFSAERPLDIPFFVYGGMRDPEVFIEDLEAWSQHGSRSARVRVFPGDHFFLVHHRDAFLRRLAEDIRQVLRHERHERTEAGAVGT